MSPGKDKQSARFRIDYELKAKIIADYQNGESVDGLTAKYAIPHPEYVRRIVKNIEKGESSQLKHSSSILLLVCLLPLHRKPCRQR